MSSRGRRAPAEALPVNASQFEKWDDQGRFSDALIGNYAVYRDDGFRYWYDYFEKEDPSLPGLTDGRAHYRHWAAEYARAGYTVGLPPVYTWERIHGWYDFESSDYRWFYNMLMVATQAAQCRTGRAPVIAFVHWHTTAPEGPSPRGKQMSEHAYRELLWHMLLRGIDGFYLWCRPHEAAKEVRLLHEVWAEAQTFSDFLNEGVPVSYQVPARPASALSGLRLDDKVLLRRTDFGRDAAEIAVDVDGTRLTIPAGLEGNFILRL